MREQSFVDAMQHNIDATQKTIEGAAEAIRNAQKAIADLQRSLYVNAMSDRAVVKAQSETSVEQGLRVPDVCAMLGLGGRTTLYRRIRAGLIPTPTNLSKTLSVWWRSEIEQVLAALRAGAGESEVKALVKRIEAGRRSGAKC